jgi:hypothetical protein
VKKQESAWWWKRISGQKCPADYALWKEVYELAAYRYELARRLFPARAYPSFIKLNRSEWQIVVSSLWHSKHPALIGCDQCAQTYNSSARLPGGQWNLEASDNLLTTIFLAMINEARASKAIAKASRNQGNRNRGPEWRCIELMDTPGKLESYDRARVSQARRVAEGLRDRFLETWRQVEENRSFLARYEKENARAVAQARESVDWSRILARK